MNRYPTLCAALLVVASCSAAPPASQVEPHESGPTELSPYERALLFALEDQESLGLGQHEGMSALTDFAGRVMKEVFGNDWSDLVAVGDQKLNSLPVIDVSSLDASSAMFEYSLPQAEIERLHAGKAERDTLAMSLLRMWEPERFADTMSSFVIGQMGSIDSIEQHAELSMLLPTTLMRTKHEGRDALVLGDAAWLFTLQYTRNSHGSFILTRATIHQRCSRANEAICH